MISKIKPKDRFKVLFICAAWLCVATPEVFSQVSTWGRHVVSMSNSSYSGNPFELQTSATFTHKSSGTSLTIPGYYAGGNVWKIGFMPTKAGEWTYVTSSPDADLNGKTGSIQVTDAGRRGLLKADPANPRKWKFASGPYVVPIGLRFDVPHEPGTLSRFTQVADFLRNGVDGHFFEFTLRNDVFSNWSANQFNLTLWDQLEQRMQVLADRGLGVHFMFYSDDLEKPAWAAQSTTEQLLIRYTVARLAAYPVVIYNTGIDIAEYRNQTWINWFGQQIRSLDPYGHPVSSRYGGGSGTYVMSGQTFDSRGDRTALIADMTGYFQTASVPVSMDDAWAENSPEAAARSKDFTQHDIRRAIWKCVFAGGLGALIRGSVLYNDDLWFRMTNIESDLESEQFLKLINPFIATQLGSTYGAMVPASSLVGNGYCIADPARTRILYLLLGTHDRYNPGNGGAVTVKLSTVTGCFSASWFDPRTGATSTAGNLTGGADHVVQPPSTDDWILLVKPCDSTTATPPANPSSLKVISIAP